MPERLTGFIDRGRAAVLLHPAALGDGALGVPAWQFVDWLAAAGFSAWQLLPLGPVGADGSPYWVRSDFAGNVDLLPAAGRGVIADDILARFSADNDHWLPDFALHQALAKRHGPTWLDWPHLLRDRHADEVAQARKLLATDIRLSVRAQCAFDCAWSALQAHARRRGVQLIGDLPMYVAPDSVETWVHRHEFMLAADGGPALLAGVPPDYFSADGQLWGNPVYDWNHAAANGFAHFRRRVRQALQRCDYLRIDHFRALAAHWVVEPGAANARHGRWVATPGRDALAALQTDCPQMPLIAEDLGDITPDVLQLRDEFGLPGMQVMQFAFDGDPDNLHQPANYRSQSVAYLGTHDNDTTLGWLLGLDSETLRRACEQFGVRPGLLPSAMRQALLRSRARLIVLTAQDILGLGSEARYNTPGSTAGNWCWQLPAGSLTQPLADALRAELAAVGRVQDSARFDTVGLA